MRSRKPRVRSVRAAEPSEALIRKWLIIFAAFAGPPLLIWMYFRLTFNGLTIPDAMDFAQLGRNIGAGHGYTTYILRPLALTHGSNPLQQPEVVNSPLYPFLLALAFGVMGARDSVVAGMSGLFYLLTIPVLYRLGARVFSRTVGMVAAAVFAINTALLYYAVSGLNVTLYVFLATALLLTLYEIAARIRSQAVNPSAHPPRGALALAGLLTAALYLTEPLFVCVIPVVVVAILSICSRRRAAVGWFLLPLLLLCVPWMARNWALTGDPVFGLRGMEIWMYTTGAYRGNLPYRMTRDEVIPSLSLFNAFVNKVFVRFGVIVDGMPGLPASWILAFFLPSLLFRFHDPAANTLRRVAIASFLALFAGMLLIGDSILPFIAVVPALLVFATAFLLQLVQQAQLPRANTFMMGSLLTIALAYPLLNRMVLARQQTSAIPEREEARGMKPLIRGREAALSDQPWLLAWYGDHPAIWIPASNAKVKDVRRQFPDSRWLFATAQVRGFSSDWQSIYDGGMRWNVFRVRGRAGQGPFPLGMRLGGRGHPLLEALEGFTTVDPPASSQPTTVVAVAPPATRTISQR